MDDGWGTDGRMGEWVDGWVHGCMDGRMGDWLDECVGGRKEGWRVEGWEDVWMGERMDG